MRHSEDIYLPAIHTAKVQEALDYGGFSGTIHPDKANGGAGFDLEGNILQDAGLAEAFAYSLEGNYGRSVGRCINHGGHGIRHSSAS